MHDIVLAPLTRDDLEQLIADSLHCEPGHADPLAELVEEKTTGNPFFAIQFFIRALSKRHCSSSITSKGSGLGT